VFSLETQKQNGYSKVFIILQALEVFQIAVMYVTRISRLCVARL